MTMEHCQSDVGRATLSCCHDNDNGLNMRENIFSIVNEI